MDQLRKDYIPEKRYPMKKYESVIGGINLKKKVDVKNHVRTNFRFERPISSGSLLQYIRDESMFGYGRCDLVVSDKLKVKISEFLPTFKKSMLPELLLRNICRQTRKRTIC